MVLSKVPFLILQTLTIVLLKCEGVTSVQCTAIEEEELTTFTCPVACCVNSKSKECCNSSQVWNLVLAVIGCVVVLGCIVAVLIFWVKSCILRGQKNRVVHPMSPHSMTMPEPPPYSAPGHDPPPYSSAPPSPTPSPSTPPYSSAPPSPTPSPSTPPYSSATPSPTLSPSTPPRPSTPHQVTGQGSSQQVFHPFTTRPSSSSITSSTIDVQQNMESNSVTHVQPVTDANGSASETEETLEISPGSRIDVSQNMDPNSVSLIQLVTNDTQLRPEKSTNQETSAVNDSSIIASQNMEPNSVKLVQSVDDDTGSLSETVDNQDSSQ